MEWLGALKYESKDQVLSSGTTQRTSRLHCVTTKDFMFTFKIGCPDLKLLKYYLLLETVISWMKKTHLSGNNMEIVNNELYIQAKF